MRLTLTRTDKKFSVFDSADDELIGYSKIELDGNITWSGRYFGLACFITTTKGERRREWMCVCDIESDVKAGWLVVERSPADGGTGGGD